MEYAVWLKRGITTEVMESGCRKFEWLGLMGINFVYSSEFPFLEFVQIFIITRLEFL